jgi:small subunit ribosomal protein S9
MAKKTKKASFIQVVGRRRTATARVRIYPHQKGEIEVNGQSIDQYFPGKLYETIYQSSMKSCNVVGKYKVTIKVTGSGVLGQLGAVVHGLSRALEKIDPKFRPILKKRGFLSRDPRKKERRKAGTGGKARRKKQSPKR